MVSLMASCESGLYRAYAQVAALKGHDFSRAAYAIKSAWALAPEGMLGMGYNLIGCSSAVLAVVGGVSKNAIRIGSWKND